MRKRKHIQNIEQLPSFGTCNAYFNGNPKEGRMFNCEMVTVINIQMYKICCLMQCKKIELH